MKAKDDMRVGPLIFLVALVAAVLLGAACTGSDRPIASDWKPIWESATDALPTLTELSSPPDRAICGHALGVLRSKRPDLLPAPDAALDVAVQEWVVVAEDAMFECPPSSHEIADLAQAYEELARLETEVNAVLDMDRATG